ncbi:hypothetical protein acdb102_46200 [Acidothermaceae bacterium B102]|nr:hypothetical protein acdb102_46200 [Acidothermaceae bacterium B102]
MTGRLRSGLILSACLGSLVACRPAAAQVIHLATPASVSTTPTRTDAETVPVATAAADLLYHPAAASGALVHAPIYGPTLRLLIATLNALPVHRHSAKTCPPTGHETAQVTVDEGPQRLQFRAALGACGTVEVTFAGAAQPTLAMTDALRTVLRDAAAPPPPAPPVGLLEPALRPFAHSRGAAVREADDALLLTSLPEAVQDAKATTVAPDDLFLDGDGTPSVIERETRWTSAMAPADLVDWVLARPPEGLRATSSQSDGTTVTQSFTTARNPYVALRFVVSPISGGSAVRVNAQVFWTPPKSAVEVIPATVTSATLRYTSPDKPNGQSGATTDLTLHGAALARVVRNLDALPTKTIDIASGCAAGFDETATVSLHNRGQRVRFVIDLGACSLVHVTSGTSTQPVLRGSESLVAIIRALVR